jgi:Anticodon binding domain/NUDIX domain
MKKIIEDRVAQIISNIAGDFDISKISRSPARFNTEKLNWFNREYIKKLSLQEFCWRASDLRLKKRFDSDKKLRVGDYVYFVDLDTNKVFANRGGSAYGQDGNFYLIGGGRDEGETPIDGLVREVSEETYGKINLDIEKLIHIDSVQLLSSVQWERDGTMWDGKDLNFWFYPLSESELPLYQLFEDGIQDKWIYDWHDLSEVIETNDYINYPIWSEFCNQNNIPVFEPTEKVLVQYLAWNLDKNRVTLLSELGMDSDCILKYIKPEKEILKWKKITLEESLANLDEIKAVIFGFYTELESQRNTLLESNINDLPNLHSVIVSEWETKLKSWIGENNKDAGSYFWPLRVALSGKEKSPSPFEILAILSKEEIKNRLKFEID